MSDKIYGNPVATPINPKKITPDVSAEDISAAVAAYMEENPITAEEVGARPADWVPSAEDVGARPNTWTPTASEVGATPASHAENKNNPHGVTAAQVGARPATWMPTAEQVGARPDNWLPTPTEIGAPSAGYGYGEPMVWLGFNEESWSSTGTFQADLEAVFASMPQGTCKQVQFIDADGLNGQKFAGTLWKYTASYGFLTATNYSGHKAIKTYYNGTWNPWEWVNPPMAVGVEYRTTERFEGAPVYCGLVSYTNASTIGNASSNVVVEISHPFSGLNKPIRVTGRQGGVYPVPNITSGGNNYTITRIDSNSIDLRLNKCTFDSRAWYFTIYYTK